MTTIIFLGGLGSNHYYAMDLQEALGLDMIIVDLPGHGTEYDTDIASLEDFVAWFSEKLAQTDGGILIAHSMGANLAPYLTTHCHNIQQLILLDGGYFDLDSLVSLEDEIAGTENYLESQVFGCKKISLRQLPQTILPSKQACKETFMLLCFNLCLGIVQLDFQRFLIGHSFQGQLLLLIQLLVFLRNLHILDSQLLIFLS